MENLENNQPEEEIQNIEQFQINRSEGNAADGHLTPEPSEDNEYTDDEVQYADGEGTQLNEEIEGPEDEEDEDDETETDDYNESDIEELDKDPNAYDDEDSEML
ncbi:hypothetical protein SRABI27_03373 [Pedobacter sp. Bi27]|uniref:hypothetical protein n=1 Tax=unclassified Pedobacter TaxID=2628915 RepID=UPI001E0324BB|nr:MULTISPECIES: hypothetical protein [unclassified Pedobacter]CAH0152621.1 hypothetical protein SRABI36_00833 [Pedobacter sp. Bi36]CAH0208885.1 hypothetical protein SRABI126_01925 [Pedobacter sp. Bi126]CAH0266741.1 hypothetical protein SRABI27_03373 [Pedobacter sp. Bi27]